MVDDVPGKLQPSSCGAKRWSKPVLIENLTTALRADDAGLLQDWQLEQDGLILASQQHCQCQNKEWRKYKHEYQSTFHSSTPLWLLMFYLR
ncbi:hypothetical protein [Sideroxydans lithotrophicus]|uniref:Uncharacterized protein n=1 Tax=Sideroxydans lithotrophicus (strain ES-1) TaxID=580332 RepID=D5CTK9_SIDLE|nr:hypothetical protein [Sideroxydans lithotrophicus]ADE10315.1 hypothetical protein Slit_0073 [Sideroxydans lithotrophicus ES-1]